MEAMATDVNPRHVLGVDDLSASEIASIFTRAAQFKEKGFASSKILDREPGNSPVVALAFFEPSTRTRLSFDSAAQRIGCKTIGFDNPELTSSAKGEQLEDTLRVIERYSEAIVVRRKDHDTIDIIREHVSVPVISAGVGAQEHPTQALMDFFTIAERRPLESVKHLCEYGDVIHARPTNSQALLLAREGVTISFVAPDEMQVAPEMVSELESRGAKVILTNKLADVVADIDVMHVVRPQRERWEGTELDAYATIDAGVLAKMKSDALVFHVLPRTGEIDPAIDDAPQNLVWELVRNGLFVRAAILEFILT